MEPKPYSSGTIKAYYHPEEDKKPVEILNEKFYSIKEIRKLLFLFKNRPIALRITFDEDPIPEPEEKELYKLIFKQ